MGRTVVRPHGWLMNLLAKCSAPISPIMRIVGRGAPLDASLAQSPIGPANSQACGSPVVRNRAMKTSYKA